MDKVLETGKGLSGLLRMYKSTMASLGLERGNKIVYVGSVGTCVPFIELLAYTVRDAHADQLYIPEGIYDESRCIWLVDMVGMQIGGMGSPDGADFIVLLGGLSMPGSKAKPEQIDSLIKKVLNPGGKVVGVCFMDMFGKAGWCDKVPFDRLIDASIDPITLRQQK